MDPAKLRRQRIYSRQKEAISHFQSIRQLRCIGFEGRIDETRLSTKLDDETPKQEIKKEDHYVLVSYPGDVYVEHVAP